MITLKGKVLLEPVIMLQYLKTAVKMHIYTYTCTHSQYAYPHRQTYTIHTHNMQKCTMDIYTGRHIQYIYIHMHKYTIHIYTGRHTQYIYTYTEHIPIHKYRHTYNTHIFTYF